MVIIKGFSVKLMCVLTYDRNVVKSSVIYQNKVLQILLIIMTESIRLLFCKPVLICNSLNINLSEHSCYAVAM